MKDSLNRDLRTYREFDCKMCGTTVTLHQYPDGTYDRYGYFVECTAHNGPCTEMHLDGWTNKPNYLCVVCSNVIQELIDTTRARVDERPMIETDDLESVRSMDT